MDIARFIQIYVVQGGFGIFFIFMFIKILKREAKGLNLILSFFYLCTAIGVLINVIYANIYIEFVVYILHFVTYFMLCFSLSFLLVFVLLVAKSNRIIDRKVQLSIIVVFSLLLLGLLLFPNGITINESTNWKPEWSWSFFVYSIIVCSVMVIAPTSYYSIKIYRKFEHPKLKKKWKFFLIGVFGYYFLYYGTSLSNTLADPTFRVIWSIISLPTLIGSYFIYYGVAKTI